MNPAIPVFLLTVLSLAACSKSSTSSASPGNLTAPSSAGDPIEKQLQELAGGNATNCGRLTSQVPEQMDAAAKCAMQATKAKQAFYVAYELPGLTIAVAGNTDGKLFTVQSESASAPGNPAGLASGACPSELRVAPSGRVTCFAKGTFGMGMDATHGGGMNKPVTGANPHQGLGIPPPGHVNPRQQQSGTPPPKQP